MNIQRAAPVNELLAKLLFLILPTAVVGYFLLWNANTYFSINQYFALFKNQEVQQTFYFAAGMVVSAILYSFRFRFLPLFAGLVILFFTIGKGLDSLAVGEFDAFFISVQFQVFAIIFTTGWVVGWGFIRLRYWSVVMSVLLLCACILLIAKGNVETVYGLLRAFVPALLYAVYIIFTAQQIYSYKDKSQRFWWFLLRRLFGFGVLTALLLGGIVYLMRVEIRETVANYGGGGREGENSMLKKNKDGTFDLKNYTKLRGNLGRNNELLFAAHIDNYFPGTDIPNPLYLTAFYYTKFDTLTETFERDAKIPYNDLFEPDPSKVPLFATRRDSNVIKNSLATKLRRSVDIEVFNKKLSPSTFLAPNVGYFVQPITVEQDFRDEFVSAFRAKSYISELNSAYFVYNSEDEQIKQFQKQRFEVLREVKGYEGMDDGFMRYYTYMPSDAKFARITDLTSKIMGGAKTPVDKVLAIRDYFLSKDENGEPLYSYTDNPGVPDIPSASKLMYFLFENHKGYCAYYAGATLFMLRSQGIPSRIAVGFLTVDRSDKNKGWYWYYADQAHAWVQVYFPGYGWLDFDTTVGNTDAEESPKPDGTPPMQPPKAWLAADGIVQSVDTIKKLMVLQVKHYVFQDKEYTPDQPTDMTLDMKVAVIRRDSLTVPLGSVDKGDEATAVSYADAFKNMKAGDGENANALMLRFPSPAPIDEVYLKRKDVKQPDDKPKAAPVEKKTSWQTIALTVGITLAAIILLVFLMPWLLFQYLRLRANGASKTDSKAYWVYRAATYYLHQVGIFRGSRTPMQYARDVVDPRLGTAFTTFMNAYLKLKYAKQPLNDREVAIVASFLAPFLGQTRKQIPFKQRLKGFLNPARMVSFFSMPSDDEVG